MIITHHVRTCKSTKILFIGNLLKLCNKKYKERKTSDLLKKTTIYHKNIVCYYCNIKSRKKEFLSYDDEKMDISYVDSSGFLFVYGVYAE